MRDEEIRIELHSPVANSIKTHRTYAPDEWAYYYLLEQDLQCRKDSPTDKTNHTVCLRIADCRLCLSLVSYSPRHSHDTHCLRVKASIKHHERHSISTAKRGCDKDRAALYSSQINDVPINCILSYRRPSDEPSPEIIRPAHEISILPSV